MYLNKKRLEIAMAKKGFKRKDLAEKCELSEQGLGKIIKKQSCRPYTIYKLTQALGVTVEYLTKEE